MVISLRLFYVGRALRKVKLYIMDAAGLATKFGLKGKINMICMGTFFRLSGVLPVNEAIGLLRQAIVKAYSHKGDDIVQRNLDLLDAVCSDPNFLVPVPIPARWRRAELTDERRRYSHRHIALIDDDKTRRFMEDIHEPVS
jgi:hypothetical protein